MPEHVLIYGQRVRLLLNEDAPSEQGSGTKRWYFVMHEDEARRDPNVTRGLTDWAPDVV